MYHVATQICLVSSFPYAMWSNLLWMDRIGSKGTLISIMLLMLYFLFLKLIFLKKDLSKYSPIFKNLMEFWKMWSNQRSMVCWPTPDLKLSEWDAVFLFIQQKKTDSSLTFVKTCKKNFELFILYSVAFNFTIPYSFVLQELGNERNPSVDNYITELTDYEEKILCFLETFGLYIRPCGCGINSGPKSILKVWNFFYCI